MPSKLISVREEIYRKLKKLKNPDESFSDLFERIIKTQEKQPLKHFGIGKHLPEEFQDEFEAVILEAKKEFAENTRRRFNELWGE
ncbi:MAG: antitoxin VapB family protein [Promethearchaeati archaeon]